MPLAEDGTNEARRAIISSHLQAIRNLPDLMRAAQVSVVSHAPERCQDVFRVDLHYAHACLPVVLAYSSRLRKPPEIYLQHEDWPNFYPRLDSIFQYNVDDPETTVAIMKEVLVKATGFQMKRLRSPAHLFIVVEETVVHAFQTLAEMMPDQFQLMLDSVKGEISWTVSLAAFLPPLDAADQKSVEARYLLKGKTSVMDLSKTKCSVEAFSELAVFFEQHRQLSFRLPKLQDARLDQHVESIAALVQTTVYDMAFAGVAEERVKTN